MSDILLMHVPNQSQPMYMMGVAVIKSFFKKTHPEVSVDIIDPVVDYLDIRKWKMSANFNSIFNTFTYQGNLKRFDGIKEEINDIVDILSMYIRNRNPQYLGFSVIDGNIDASLVIAKKIKNKFSKLNIIFGGIGMELMRKSLTENRRDDGLSPNNYYLYDEYDFIDYIVFGDSGEMTLSELYFNNKNKKKLNKIKGLKYRENNKWISNGRSAINWDLSNLSLLGYEGLEHNEYYIRSYGNSVPLVISKGCPYKCTFCSVPTFVPEFRYRPLDSVFDEIEHWIHKGKNDFFCHDSIVNGNPQTLEAFCNGIIERGWGDKIIWGGNFRMQSPMRDINTLKLYVDSGMNRMISGVESASHDVLRHMKKYNSVDGIREIFNNIRELNKDLPDERKIKVWLQLIIGYLNETEEDFQMTYNFVEEYSDVIDWILTCGTFLLWYPLKLQWEAEGNWIEQVKGSDVLWETEYSNIDIRLERLKRIENLYIKLGLRYNVQDWGARQDVESTGPNKIR